MPGANLGAGGNGSNGCAKTGSDRIIANTALSGSYLMTLGEENLTNNAFTKYIDVIDYSSSILILKNTNTPDLAAFNN